MADYDYIIVGAGSAGGALAARLSENPASKILLLEAGAASHPYSRMPLSFGLLIDNPAANWCYQSEPEANTANRVIPVPRGKLLGGSSSINGLVWVRGQPLDYDTWAQMGCRGWSWRDVAPLFTRIETFVDGDGSHGRGTSGPLKVSTVPDQNPLYDALFAAAKAAGFKLNPDYNSEDQEGVVKTQTSIYKGRRMSVAHCYIEPAAKRSPNLHIETDTHTLRVLLDGKRCVGVEYEKDGKVVQARARETIVSAGGVASPGVLELSGIGQPELLKKHGIEVKHELKGVGENYGDHFAPRLTFRINQKVSLNEQTRGLSLLKAIAQYYTSHTGVLTYNAGMVAGFVRTRPGLETPDMQLHVLPGSYDSTSPKRLLEREPGMTVILGQCRPDSRGSIHIKSPTPGTEPAIRPNFLSAQTDRDAAVAGMQIARKIMQSPAIAKYIAFENKPGDKVQSYDQWLDYARHTGTTTFHVIGTCKMG